MRRGTLLLGGAPAVAPAQDVTHPDRPADGDRGRAPAGPRGSVDGLIAAHGGHGVIHYRHRRA
jgi:hypothetical protein